MAKARDFGPRIVGSIPTAPANLEGKANVDAVDGGMGCLDDRGSSMDHPRDRVVPHLEQASMNKQSRAAASAKAWRTRKRMAAARAAEARGCVQSGGEQSAAPETRERTSDDDKAA